jgi:hypothetical protein
MAAFASRMEAALSLLPSASSQMRDALAAWVKHMDPASKRDCSSFASIDAELVTTGWFLAAEIADIRTKIEAYFADFGAEQKEASLYEATVLSFKPTHAGIWAELGDDAIDTGWCFDMRLPFIRALAMADGGVVGPKLAKWAERHHIDAAFYIARSVGAQNPYYEIRVEVPSVAVMEDAFKSINVPFPNNAIVTNIFYDLARSGLAMSFWITAKGVTRIGMFGRRPPQDKILLLLKTRDVFDIDLLHKFEEKLQVTSGPEWVEHQTMAGRTKLLFHYPKQQ